MKRTRERGFTLMELLVVAVIIAIVATLAIPRVDQMIESGRSTACISNLRQLGAGLNAYLAEHNATMPEMEMGRKSKDQQVEVLDTVLKPYLRDERVYACPSDTKKHIAEVTGTSYFWNSSLNNQHLGGLNFLKLTDDTSKIPLIGDKEGFHPYISSKVNILYADGHASKELDFKTEK